MPGPTIDGGLVWSFGQPAPPVDPRSNALQQLEQAVQLHQLGQSDRARAICQSLVDHHPDYFGALYTLGLIYSDQGLFLQALPCLVRAVMLDAGSGKALIALGGVYLELGASEMAVHTLHQASLIEPENPSLFLILGEVYRQERDYQAARDAFSKALVLDPELHAAALALGTCCAELGDDAEAAAVFQRLLNRGIRSHSVIYELTELSRSLVNVDLLAEIDKLVRSDNEDEAEFEITVAFVRAAALEKAGRHGEAWENLVIGNRAMYRRFNQDASTLRKTHEETIAELRRTAIAPPHGNNDADTQSISLFILGASRAGKSTLEKLLSTLDGVKRGHENPIVDHAVRRTFQSAGLLASNRFAELPPALDSQCRRFYFEELARRARTAKVFTNTHPMRINDVARIAAAFPDVRFVCLKRNLEDNMFRIYLRKYGSSGHEYAYDLETIRDHLLWYDKMIDLIAEQLPNLTRVIHYEDMVADPAEARRSVAELCGLQSSGGPLPEIGDDRRCARPYRRYMTLDRQG